MLNTEQAAEILAQRPVPESPCDPADVQRLFYQEIADNRMVPLWEELKGLVSKEPAPQYVPYLWRFEVARQLVLRAGELIDAEDAVRRVLVLENPGLRGKHQTTNALFAGIQLILPGEIAPTHRHVASAVRFVLEGEGAYTQVDGEKALMRRGDFIVTPSYAPHDHGNTSNQPMIWLDVLDLPTVKFFEAGFFAHIGHKQEARRQPGDSLLRFGSGVLPERVDRTVAFSPIVNYPFARMKRILTQLAQTGDIDPRHGARVRYSNPLNGGPVTPTMGAHLALLPAGFVGEPYRSTEGTIFVCVEGEGSTRIENETFDWSPGDVFVVPGWKRHAHIAKRESVLFGISDRPAQQALGIWREEAIGGGSKA